MKLQHSSSHTRRAFTLLELCAVMWVLGLTLVIGVGILVASFKLDQASRKTLERLSVHNQLADRFRQDVASAEGAAFPRDSDAEDAVPQSLVLRFAADHHVKYQWADVYVERIEERGGQLSRQQFRIDPGCAGTSFFWAGFDNPVITMRLLEKTKDGTRGFDISAALRGDRR